MEDWKLTIDDKRRESKIWKKRGKEGEKGSCCICGEKEGLYNCCFGRRRQLGTVGTQNNTVTVYEYALPVREKLCPKCLKWEYLHETGAKVVIFCPLILGLVFTALGIFLLSRIGFNSNGDSACVILSVIGLLCVFFPLKTLLIGKKFSKDEGNLALYRIYTGRNVNPNLRMREGYYFPSETKSTMSDPLCTPTNELRILDAIAKSKNAPKKQETAPKKQETASKAAEPDIQLSEPLDQYGRSEMMNAALRGDITKVIQLISLGAEVDRRDCDDNTALILASSKGYADIVSLLLENGANVNAKTMEKYTALMAAAEGHYPEVVSILLKHGANPDMQRRNGLTALMHTWSSDTTAEAELLLKAGADPDIKDPTGKTAMDYISNHSSIKKEMEELFAKYAKSKSESKPKASPDKTQQAEAYEIPQSVKSVWNELKGMGYKISAEEVNKAVQAKRNEFAARRIRYFGSDFELALGSLVLKALPDPYEGYAQEILKIFSKPLDKNTYQSELRKIGEKMNDNHKQILVVKRAEVLCKQAVVSGNVSAGNFSIGTMEYAWAGLGGWMP